MTNGKQGVSASSDQGPVEVRQTTEGARETGVSAQGGEVQIETRETEQNVANPLAEPEITVRVRQGVEFFHQGTRRKAGDEFPMAISQARAASVYVDEVTAQGLRTIPHEQQQIGGVARANLAGMQRHERIGALEAEEQELAKRLDEVRGRLDHERKAVAAARQEPAGPAGGTNRADLNRPHEPVSGVESTTANTSQSPRPAEAAMNTPVANKGPEAKR